MSQVGEKMTMNRSRVGPLVSFITLSFVAFAVPPAWTQTVPVSTTIAVSKNTAKLGSSLLVEITLRNVSDNEIFVSEEPNFRQGEKNYLVEMWDSKGQPVQETDYYRRYKCAFQEGPCSSSEPPSTFVGSSWSVKLAPGAALKNENVPDTDVVELNKLFRLTAPGEYKVQVQRDDEHLPGGHRPSDYSKSNILTITLAP